MFIPHTLLSSIFPSVKERPIKEGSSKEELPCEQPIEALYTSCKARKGSHPHKKG